MQSLKFIAASFSVLSALALAAPTPFKAESGGVFEIVRYLLGCPRCILVLIHREESCRSAVSQSASSISRACFDNLTGQEVAVVQGLRIEERAPACSLYTTVIWRVCW